MELRSKVTYHDAFGSLYPGDTTEGRDIPEDVKQKMATDFPDWFEVISTGKAPATEPQEENTKKQRK